MNQQTASIVLNIFATKLRPTGATVGSNFRTRYFVKVGLTLNIYFVSTYSQTAMNHRLELLFSGHYKLCQF